MWSRPTLATLAAFLVVFTLQGASGLLGVSAGAFALALPLEERAWTIVVSVYAHAGLWHLAANGLGVALLGPLVARGTTPMRFHGFFAGTGAAAGIAQVVVTAPLGTTAVLGASGAVFALLGYVAVANPVSEATIGRLSRRAQIVVLLGVAIAVTLATAAPGVALVAHAVGFLLGAGAGRLRLLEVSRS